MSGIDKPLKVPLLVKRGKSALFTVQPLPDAPAPKPAASWREQADAVNGDPTKLRTIWNAANTSGATPEDLDYIKNSVKEA